MRILLGLVLAVAACGKGNDVCTDAIQHVSSFTPPPPKEAKPEMQKWILDVGAATTKSMLGSCQADKWSKETTDCLKAAAKAEDLDKCEKLLTPDQRQASGAAARKAMESIPQPGSADQIDKAEVLKGITDQRDRLCACKDAACAEAIDKEWKKLKLSSERARHDEDTSKQFNKIDDERFKCYQALTKK